MPSEINPFKLYSTILIEIVYLSERDRNRDRERKKKRERMFFDFIRCFKF